MKQVNANMNGIDVEALGEVVEQIQADPSKAKVAFAATTRWLGQTSSETRIDGYTIAGERVERPFRFVTDEPHELLGTNTAPNPQEYLLGALNACMIVGYAANAAVRGIAVRSLEIESSGDLDLRGFLALDPQVIPGYAEVRTVVRIEADATREQLEELHAHIKRTSPNYFNVGQPIALDAELVVVE